MEQDMPELPEGSKSRSVFIIHETIYIARGKPVDNLLNLFTHLTFLCFLLTYIALTSDKQNIKVVFKLVHHTMPFILRYGIDSSVNETRLICYFHTSPPAISFSMVFTFASLSTGGNVLHVFLRHSADKHIHAHTPATFIHVSTVPQCRHL